MQHFKTKNFKSDKKGLAKVLGSLEHVVMEALWSRGDATGREVHREVARERKVAITTVHTVLERLLKKGLISRVKGEGGYRFTPTMSREGFAKEVSREVMAGVVELWAAPAAATFVDILADKDPAELDKLEALIEEKKGKLERGRG